MSAPSSVVAKGETETTLLFLFGFFFFSFFLFFFPLDASFIPHDHLTFSPLQPFSIFPDILLFLFFFRYTDGSGLYKHTEQCHQDDEVSRKKAAAQLTAGMNLKTGGAQPSPQHTGSSSSRRHLPRGQQRKDLEDYETGEGLSDSDERVDDSDGVGESDNEVAAGQSNGNDDLSDYDDEDSPTKKTPKKHVSFSDGSDGSDDSSSPPRQQQPLSPPQPQQQQQQQPLLPHLASVLPPSSTGTNYVAAAAAASKNGIPSNLQATFRVPVTSQQQQETTLKRRSMDMDEAFAVLGQEPFAGPLRHSPSFTLPLSDYTVPQGGRPVKQARMRLSMSEPNLKAYADDDLSDEERRQQQLQTHSRQPHTSSGNQEGAIDLLLYFSQHPKQSPCNSVPSSPVPSPLPAPSSAAMDPLKLPPLASLRLGSPVMSHGDPRYNSFTSLSSTYPPAQAVAAPTTPSKEPVSPTPATPFGGLLPPITSITALPPLNPLAGPIKVSRSAPGSLNLTSEAGSFSFAQQPAAGLLAQLAQLHGSR